MVTWGLGILRYDVTLSQSLTLDNIYITGVIRQNYCLIHAGPNLFQL
jgi:hypothetical protein